MSSLKDRLQNPDYINWVKAALCLIHTKSGLDEFANTASQSLHQTILTNIVPALASSAQPVCGIAIKRQTLTTICTPPHPYCNGFLTEVLRHGIDRTHKFTVKPGNLANCNVQQWHKQHWEVAKLFMNSGQQSTQTNFYQTDMSGIINFISHCAVPRRKMTNVYLVDGVRNARNGIMHTADMYLSAIDLQTYSQDMIDLLSDPGISCFKGAQLAVAEIQTIIKAVEFQITLEDESKVMDQLAEEIRTMAQEMQQKIAAVEEGGKADAEQLHKEIEEVSKCYTGLKDMTEKDTEIRKRMAETISSLGKHLATITADFQKFQDRLDDVEQAVGTLRADYETTRIQTKQDIDDVKEAQKQTKEKVDELTNTNTLRRSIPTDKDRKRLREYLQSRYKDSRYCKVTPLPDWVGLTVRDIFSPVVLVRNSKDNQEIVVSPSDPFYPSDPFSKKMTLQKRHILLGEAREVTDFFTPVDLDSKGSKETLSSYNELFYTKGVLQKKIFLLGDAGAGKTTFCKHLTDEWCNPTPNQQFDDVDVLQQYPFLFYVSCRFAEKNDTILEMIKNQLFDDDEIRDIACNVLKHNSNSCVIVIDGYDELQRTALAETGEPADITGLPSLKGVQNCVLLITSRPWKFFSIPKDEQEMFSRLELDGIKDPAELVEIIFHKHQMPDPAKICSDFLADINERNMSELIKYPLMLIFAIDVWLQNESLPKSVCLCYINMIKLSIDRFETKGEKVNIDNTKMGVEKFLDSSKPGKPLPNVFSNFKCVQRTACLFYSLGHLASDLLLGQEKQSLVFQKDVCERYKICDDDGSLKRCLDLGLLTKLESTVRGIKQKENFQFCHSSFQEFFAALWLSTKNNEEESQENLNLYTCIKNEDNLLNNSLLIQFICGLCPEAGTDFWAYIAQKNIILLKGKEIQDLILKSVKEAHECCDHQGKHVYYCIPRVYINKDTSDEDISLLCKMISQYNSTNLKSLNMETDTILSSSHYHCLLSYVACATNLTTLALNSISCQQNDNSDRLPALDLQKHHKLEALRLDKISISDLVLPSQGESELSKLYLYNLVLSHDNLVQLCSSLSSLSSLLDLRLDNLSCSDDGDSCRISVLDLHKHLKLKWLILDEISISSLVLPSQGESGLGVLYLDNLVLSHDNLVQLCSSLSSLSSLQDLRLDNLSCSDDGDSCCISVLDLHKHLKLKWLILDKISISILVLPSQGQSELSLLYLYNLGLSHDNLVQLCTSLSSLSSLQHLRLENLSCSDDGDSCRISVLDLHKHHKLHRLQLDKISISSLVLPSQGESGLSVLRLNNLVLSHDNLVQLCTSLSSLSSLEILQLDNLSCSDGGDSCRISVLDLHKHHKLKTLYLDKISITSLVLPSQEGSELSVMYLDNLVLSHDNLVQLCTSLSSMSSLKRLTLSKMSCSDDGDSCLSVLDLHKHHKLETLQLVKIYISGLLLPSQGESKLSILFLDNLVLSHDNLVQLCTSLSSLSSLEKLVLINLVLSHDNLVQLCSSLSSLSSLEELVLDNLSCSDDGGSCISVLDLHKHHKLKTLSLDKIYISSLVYPSQGESELRALCLYNLVLSHDNLVQLCSSLSSLSSLEELVLYKLSCSDDGGSCRISVLDLHKHHKLVTVKLDKISISSLVVPSQGESELSALYLVNLVTSHDNLVQLCSSLSSLSSLEELVLDNLSCNDDGDSCRLSVLDLHRHHRLELIKLDKISINSLLLPSPEQPNLYNLDNGLLLPTSVESRLVYIELNNLVLSHDSMVQLCCSLSYLSALCHLQLTNLLCYNHCGSGDIPMLDLPKADLKCLSVEKIPDEDLQALSGLQDLQPPLMPCGKDCSFCVFSVLNLQKHHRLKVLKFDTSSISGLILPRQKRINITDLDLKNLTLTHFSLERLCTSPASMPDLDNLLLTNLSCSDHGDSCRLPALDLRIHIWFELLKLDKIPISGLLLPSMQQSKWTIKWKDPELKDLTLSHDSLLQLCRFLSCVSAIKLTHLSCSDHSGSCTLPVLDLPKAELQYSGLSSDAAID